MTGCNQAGVPCPGTAAEDLALELSLAWALGSQCQHQKGWWAGNSESFGMDTWTNILEVEEEPVGILPGFSAPLVNIHPLDLGQVRHKMFVSEQTSRELLTRIHLCFKQKSKAAMPQWIKAHCSALTICQAPCPQCLCVCSGGDRELPTLYHGRLCFAFSLLHSPCEHFGFLPPVAQMQVLDHGHGEVGTENKEILGYLWMKMRLEGAGVGSPRVCRYQGSTGTKRAIVPLGTMLKDVI